MQIGLGIITVASPGTKVKITNNQTSPTARLNCQSVLIQALANPTHTNTGKIYIFDYFGTRVATLAVPTANTIPSFSATIPGTLALDASLYSVDADNTGDGVDASYLVP